MYNKDVMLCGIKYKVFLVTSRSLFAAASFHRPFPDSDLSHTKSVWHFALKAQHTVVSYANALSVIVVLDVFCASQQCLICSTPKYTAHACRERSRFCCLHPKHCVLTLRSVRRHLKKPFTYAMEQISS
jgi:hypothetical protein